MSVAVRKIGAPLASAWRPRPAGDAPSDPCSPSLGRNARRNGRGRLDSLQPARAPIREDCARTRDASIAVAGQTVHAVEQPGVLERDHLAGSLVDDLLHFAL